MSVSQTLTAQWTDLSGQDHADQVIVVSPTAVPDPDIPVVILLHGMSGDYDDMNDPAAHAGIAVDMTTPIVTVARGAHSYPNIGIWGVSEDVPLVPAPAGWQPYLTSQNFITLNYSQISPQGSLAQVGNQASDPVRQLQGIVAGVIAAFPGRRIAFVTHSRGGLLLRAWLVEHGQDAAVQPRLSTVVQLVAPNQGTIVADVAAEIHDVVEVLEVLAWISGSLLLVPLFELIDGQVDMPAVPDMEPGGDFLQWLASNEPTSPDPPPPAPPAVILHTFGGTNPDLTRLHMWVFTLDSLVPILMIQGFSITVTFYWYTADEPVFGVRNMAGDLAQPENPAICPGQGDILVSADGAKLPWAVAHHVNSINHAQALWDPGVKAQALPVLQQAVAMGGPSLQVGAAWATWSQPASVTIGAQFSIAVTVVNVGTTTWSAGFTVGADDGAGNAIWAGLAAQLTTAVARGGSAPVTLSLTAPATPSAALLSVYVAGPAGKLQRGQPSQPIQVVGPCQQLASQYQTLASQYAALEQQLEEATVLAAKTGQPPGNLGPLTAQIAAVQSQMTTIKNEMAAAGCPPPTP